MQIASYIIRTVARNQKPTTSAKHSQQKSRNCNK